MIHHCVLCKLDPGVSEAELEGMIRAARSRLLRIGETLGVKSGRSIDGGEEFAFFFAVDAESLDKLAALRDDPIYLKFMTEVIEPHTWGRRELTYETEPGRDPKYS